MPPLKPFVPPQFNTSQVIVRFMLRLALLSVFANLSTHGFEKSFAALLVMSAIFCVIVGAMRREAMFGPVLTHWDEAAAYAVVDRLVSVLA